MSYVVERPRWPMQSSNNGRKKKAKGIKEREIRASLLILDFERWQLVGLSELC